MKHAYLILVHHQFEVLKNLLSALDDERNDIFIHFDKKVKELPILHTLKARLFVLECRVDVRWGHVSQIEAEYVLFEEAAANGPYTYYHVISGSHLPLHSQNSIHAFFRDLNGKDMLTKMEGSPVEISLKLQRYNLFVKNYIAPSPIKQRFYQFLWTISIRIQKTLGITVNKNKRFFKSANWVSLTETALHYIVQHKAEVLKSYRYTLCGDEYFVASLLENSLLSNNIFYYDKVLKCEFEGANPKNYTDKDFEDIMSSGCLFARKFTEADMEVVHKILTKVV